MTLCDPIDYSLPRSSVHGDSPGKSTGVGCHVLLQGNLSKPLVKPRSPALQCDSLLSEPSLIHEHLYPSRLQSTGSQRVRNDLAAEQQQQSLILFPPSMYIFLFILVLFSLFSNEYFCA